MKVTVTNIKWDTDGMSAKKLGLPKSVEIDVPFEEMDEECYDYIDDYLSDTYGYCFFGYSA